MVAGLPSLPTASLPSIPPAAIGGFRLGKFIPNPVGIAKLQVTPSMIAAMLAKAQKAADASIAVWHSSGPHPYETGEYVDSIKAEAGVVDARAVGRVNAYDWKAWWLEFGTSDTPAFAPLRRGADESGLHLTSEVQKGR